MRWKATLFGPFRLVGPDGRQFQTRSKRLKAMLAYLASQPSGRVDRHSLAEALFDLDDVPGIPNLAVLLTRAQSSLADHSDLTLIVATGEDVSLVASNFECDLGNFENLVRRARSETDPLIASVAWHDALKIADRKLLSNCDHPLLSPIRERIGAAVLGALANLAAGPLGSQHSDLILERLGEFDLEQTCDARRTEQLMRIFAALGMKEAVVQTFSSYETHLDYDCGEGVPSALSALYDSLLAGMDQPQAPSWGLAPEPPQAVVGRHECLGALVEALEGTDCQTRLRSVTGQCGIGKSHLLKALFWQLFPRVATAHFDLEIQPTEVVSKILNDRPCQVVLIDHVRAEHHSIVGRLLRSHPETCFVCASHSRLGLPGESLITIGPLEVGEASHPGPAIELLELNLRLVQDASHAASGQAPDPLLFELASLCDGIPLALEIAGRLSGSIGLKATINSLRRNVDALSNDRGDTSRRASLRNAIESSWQNLGLGAQRLVAFLAGLGARCHIDQLLRCTEAMPCELEEGILSGLVVRESRSSYVCVLSSTASVLKVAVDSGPFALEIVRYCAKSTAWFEEKSTEQPLDLVIADSLPLALQMVDRLIEADESDGAIALFASIRHWLGSIQLGPSQLEGIDRLLMGDGVEKPERLRAVLTLSAAYFHAGEFARMREILAKALQLLNESSVSGEVRFKLTVQHGLAERAMGNFGEAIANYRQALAVADESVGEAIMVTCHYNLGTLLEAQGMLGEALGAQEAASDHFSSDTDPRVETLVNTCIGRLRYRLGKDLDSACLILEATLAHAREGHDLRSAGEILQNLGQIYWERKDYAKAALAETTGCCLLLGFGYHEEFRRLAKSSFVTLCACFFELELDALAHTTRTLIDRLGPADLYAPNQMLFERLADKTYAQPPGLKLGVAGESEVRKHLLGCFEQLQGRCLSLGAHFDFANLVHSSEEARLDEPSVGTAALPRGAMP